LLLRLYVAATADISAEIAPYATDNIYYFEADFSLEKVPDTKPAGSIFYKLQLTICNDRF